MQLSLPFGDDTKVNLLTALLHVSLSICSVSSQLTMISLAKYSVERVDNSVGDMLGCCAELT